MTSWRSRVRSEAPLTYENLVDEFLAVFPDLRRSYEERAHLFWDEDGLIGHAFIGSLLTADVIVAELERDDRSGRNPRLEKAFRFVERLLASPDDRVVDTGDTPCEQILDDNLFERAKPYLGTRARTLCGEIRAHDASVVEHHGPPWWSDEPETVADEDGTSDR